MLASLEEIFCSIDDFCKYFYKNNQNYFLANSVKKRNKPCSMSLRQEHNKKVLGELHSCQYN